MLQMLIALMVDAFVSKMQAREASRRDPENYRIKNNSCYPERQCECPKKCFCCPHNTNCCPKGANILAVLGLDTTPKKRLSNSYLLF